MLFRSADLGGADLGGADLRGAYLGGAYLGGAYLSGYSESHDVFNYAVEKEKTELFTEHEWYMIGVIINKRICWDTIKNMFGNDIMTVFEKLKLAGWKEWSEKYQQYMKA